MASSPPDPATIKRPRLSRGRAVIAAIGIDRYEAWPALSNAVNDARSVLARFRELGFEELPGTSLFDGAASGDAIRKLVIDDLRVALTAEDSLVLFFAGHGYTTRREIAGGETIKTGYLIGANGELPEGNIGHWIELDAWLRGVAQLPARHILVVLDACHSGIALRLTKYRDVEVPGGGSLDPLRQRRSRRVITSALDDQRALDSGPRPGHSLFTACLLEALANDTGSGRSVTGSEIGLYLQKQVGDRSAAKQTPDFGVLEYDDRGELVLELSPGGIVEVVVDAGRHHPPPGWRRRRPWFAAGLAVGMALVAAVLVLPRLLDAPTPPAGGRDASVVDGAREVKIDQVGGSATIVQPPGVELESVVFEREAASERMLVRASSGLEVAVRDVKQQGSLSLAILPAASSGFSIDFEDQGTLTCESDARNIVRFAVDPPVRKLEIAVGGHLSSWSATRELGLAHACIPTNGDVVLAQLLRGQHLTLPSGLRIARVGVRRSSSEGMNPDDIAWAPCEAGGTARGIELFGAGDADAAAFGFARIGGTHAVTCSPPKTVPQQDRVCTLGDAELRCESVYRGPCRLQTDGEIVPGGESASCMAATPAETKRARDTGLKSAPRLHCTEVYRCR